MTKNLFWKNILIVAFAVVAAYTLFPPEKKLKPGIDLAGGTSLIYEIDASGLTSSKKSGLSESMITILRRRIDPANVQNLVWRPQGDTRFEIQMPLANVEAREKRSQYELALTAVLEGNINKAAILRSLSADAQQRLEDFERFSGGSEKLAKVLDDLAVVYNERQDVRKQRDDFERQLDMPRNIVKIAGLNSEEIEANLNKWSKLDPNSLKDELLNYLGSEGNLDMLTKYVNIYSSWAQTVNELTEPETGLNDRYAVAVNELDKFTLSQEQLEFVLSLPSESSSRQEAIDKLLETFQQRQQELAGLIAAYDDYAPFRGNLDDPKDLQRMLKGAGILEFRILPTTDRSELSKDVMEEYVASLKEKGPQYASDDDYVWVELEAKDEKEVVSWIYQTKAVVGTFGNKYYVLASDQQEEDEAILHTGDKQWKLKEASAGRDQSGRRAIDFVLDERGGKLFGKVTSKNIQRPLCILLDGIAISAPNINSQIYSHGQITGSYSEDQVNDMVNKLNAGSLPAMLIEQPISVKTIGPSIGADNRDKGIKAGIIGFIIVVAFMMVYYTLAGSIADVALFLNLLFVLAIMVFLRATFTLPGIAGIILTIGMSVDANVLIFERIREEQGKGSSLLIAVKNGYERAFSTIFDANLTTFITAAILYWVASEEIKGFAIVLMLGIASSMFTSLFVTRLIFDTLIKNKLITKHLFMLRIIGKPKINWMKARGVFLTVSSILIVAGLFVFFNRNSKYDIEFTGGTSVQINFKEGVQLNRQQVEDMICGKGKELENSALASANVYSVGETGLQYEITTTATNKTSANITFEGQAPAIETMVAALSEKLDNVYVTGQGQTFELVTSTTNKSLVKLTVNNAFENVQITEPQVDELVNNAILEAFGDRLAIQRNLIPSIAETQKISDEVIGKYPELSDFVGGIMIKCTLQRKATAEQVDRRLKDLRFKPDMRDLKWYSYKIFDDNIEEPKENQLESFVYVSADPEAGLREFDQSEWNKFKENEVSRVTAATSLETSLPRVTQISPSIGDEAKTKALIAIVLSLFAIVTYVWVRFGDARYGFAAIAALVHDVCITLGVVVSCAYLAKTAFGQMLLIGDFKIDLAMIAAFLTLIGYSLNDTIVVFDRIRENRHKGLLSKSIINDSINQTISRTIITSFTTFIVVLIMYIFGGQGLRGFTFAIGIGIIVGTYSSIAIAAPILLIGHKAINRKKKDKLSKS